MTELHPDVVAVARVWHQVFGRERCWLAEHCPICGDKDWPDATWVAKGEDMGYDDCDVCRTARLHTSFSGPVLDKAVKG